MFYYTEFLATHGWIISAPDHTGNTMYDDTGNFNQVLARRPIDIKNSFDWLVAQSDDPESGMYGCVDESAGYAVSGFSFGGYTAYATGGALVNNLAGTPSEDYSDERVWGIVTIAPWYAYYLTTGTSEIDVPVMSIGGNRDDTVGTDYQNLHASITSTPRVLGAFPNAGHLTWHPIYCWSNGNGCGPDYVDQDDATEVLKTSVTAWLEHLRGKEGAIEQLSKLGSELSWDLVEE
jgi:predicted dienelactone hydrolase